MNTFKQLSKLSVILVFVAFFLPLSAQNEGVDAFFEKHEKNENCKMVYISPKVLEMISLKESELEDEIQDVLEDIKGIKIATTTSEPIVFFDEAIETFKDENFELLIKVHEDIEQIQFMIKEDKDQMDELLLIVGSESEAMVMSILGSIDLKKLSELGESMELEGFEHLEKLED